MKFRWMAVTALAAVSASAAAQAPAEPEPAPVRLNQLGLLPGEVKRAIVPHASTTPLPWRLTDPQGRVRASGTTTVFGQDPWSGQHVHQIDVSDFGGTGAAFALQVGDRYSRPFDISNRSYDQLPHDALAYFYHNRAGTEIEPRFVGEAWARPAGHPDERATCVSGKDSNGNVWPGCPYTLEVTGGWYDAGDHGKYIVNGGISLWTLQNLVERQRANGSRLFADGKARIPEAGNGRSDLLDETRWEMEFFLKMQVPEGSRQSVPVAIKRNAKGLTFIEIDSSGMAHHKVADEKWTALPMRPHEDPERRQLFPPSTSATLNLAAAAAQCARIWRSVDDEFAARCLAAARRAWAAALRNPQVYPIADFTGSGGYGDEDFSDEFYWAAAELLATTGEAQFKKAVEDSPHFRSAIAGAPGWNSVAPLGTITLAIVPKALEPAEQARLRAQIQAVSDRFLAERAKVGYAIPFASKWVWGSTSSLLNRAILLALAEDFTGEARYRAGVVDLMDFILGRNPLDRSFVSGYGARPMRNPHHRFWAHSLDQSLPPPPPGALSGGPNQNTDQDEVGPTLKGCAPQTCWADDIRAYSLNEVAINWNAPLVWVSSWLHRQAAE
ncbi:MAG TPA: glycoside hydrolase family 9 protein [Sphingomicrobium sp.]|nr:glycoside hydrolase family 9 protein [Sphingomicrobium sp.]